MKYKVDVAVICEIIETVEVDADTPLQAMDLAKIQAEENLYEQVCFIDRFSILSMEDDNGNQV